MKKANGRRRAGHASRKRVSKRTLLIGRIAAGVLVALAVALAIFLRGVPLGPAALMWGSACVLLVLLAVTLSVRLPVSRALQCCLGVLCLALLAGGYLNHFYARLNGRFVPRYALVTDLQVIDEYPSNFTRMESLSTLDMRGSTVTDFEPLKALPALARVDLRENYAFDQEAHDALALAKPDCDIRWSVPVKDTYFDSAVEEMDVSALPLSIQELRQLFDQYPGKRIVYKVPLMGQSYAMDVTELDLQGKSVDVSGIDEALGLLTGVRTVDLRGEKTGVETIAAMCEARPDIHFMFTCDVPGEMTTEDVKVKVQGSYEDLLAYMAYADYMPNLAQMDAEGVQMTDEQVDALGTGALGGRLKYNVPVFGKTVSSLATDLNLDNVPVPGVEAMEACIARLPKLERVSMCGCGLSEDEMGRLFDAHPEIKFIWWIEFGKYKLRTDATAFTTGLWDGNDYGYNNATFAPIRYCTDLMMLDLGHNKIKDLEFIRGLKKLRLLILADNKISDISVLAELPDLEYVELFLNDITDVSPLTGLKNLVDLNVFYNPLYENHKVLSSMTWLKRLWIGGCRLSNQDVKNLQAALPNTRINVKGRSSTGNGWREHPHYFTLKKMYEEERYIPFDD